MADVDVTRVVVLDSDSRAKALAKHLDLPVVEVMPASGLVLVYEQDGLGLVPADGASGAVTVDFVTGRHRHRRLYGGGKGQQIAKAVGLQTGCELNVFDATAGLGGDSFVLASLGCDITMAERHPVVRALLDDGLARLQASQDIPEVSARLRLMPGDAMAIFSACQEVPPQVIYLDPMFPHTGKSAQVKKDMAMFRQLVGADIDADALLAPALALASHRVVVKRPRLAPCLADQKPTYALIGKANRFDVYVNAAFK